MSPAYVSATHQCPRWVARTARAAAGKPNPVSVIRAQLMAAGAPGPLGQPAQLPVLEGSVSAHVFATALSPSMEGRTVSGM